MKDFFQKYGIRFLAIATVIAVLLSILSYLSSTSLFLRNFSGVLTHPFQSAAAAVDAWSEKRQKRYEDTTALQKENEALRHQLADAQTKLRQAEADSEENGRLRKLLSLKEQRRDFSFAAAHIVSRNTTNWCSVFTLDAGTSEDIAVGDCVVTQDGYLVGIITEVGKNWSSITTVIDSDTEIGARIFRTSEVVMAQGDFALMGKNQLKISFLADAAGFVAGDYVVTSGLGGYYPSGIVIGTVDSRRTDSGEDAYAVVNPLADLDSLGEVFVITEYEVVE